jgi:glycosyltransferase involved in cell wall biosynthesis
VTAAIDVIIRTTCAPARARLLARSVSSVLDQIVGDPEVIVVANGPDVDRSTLETVGNRPGIRIVRQREADPLTALLAGRRAVQAPLFAFLDDDDEFLPGALEHRLDLMATHPGADVVVTNGFRCSHGQDQLVMPSMETATRDPFGALLRRNWLLSCAGTYRTERILEETFVTRQYFEWTTIGFLLACRHTTFVFSDVPTYRVNDTPDSLSKSAAFDDAEVTVLADLVARAPTGPTRRLVRAKLAAAHHSAADRALTQGLVARACAHHLRSLRHPSGWRYLPFAYRLLQRTFR